jgi:hypothetical protein
VGLADLVIAGLVLAGALGLLYRSLRRSAAGGCHGCSGGGCRRDAPPEVVRLGAGRADQRGRRAALPGAGPSSS